MYVSPSGRGTFDAQSIPLGSTVIVSCAITAERLQSHNTLMLNFCAKVFVISEVKQFKCKKDYF